MAKLNRICSVDGCGKAHKAKGLCRMHYLRVRRNGSTKSNTRKNKWILDHVDYAGQDCLLYPFGKTAGGYGAVTYKGVSENAHRLMCRLAHGEPKGKQVARHKCKSRACCNPNHLEWGSVSENMLDKLRDGTDNRGSKNPIAKLSEEDVLQILRASEKQTQASLAKDFGVTRHAIRLITLGENWGWLKDRSDASERLADG